MPQPLALNLGEGVPPEEMPSLLARLRVADEMGVDSVWLSESWGREIFTTMGRLAGEIRNMKLATGIVNVYTRSAAVLATSFATLDEMTGGRVIAGLGTSGQLLIEGLHGVPFENPLRRTREYVEIIRSLLAGEKLVYEGEIFQLTRGFKLLFAPVRSSIPIYIAAISPKGIDQAGAIADGWIPIWWPKERLPWARDRLATAAKEAGREPPAIAPSLTVKVVPPGGDRSAALEEGKEHIAFYVNRMGRYYWQMLERNGYEAEVRASRAAFEAGDRKAANAAVSDRMADSIIIAGSLEECAERLREWRSLGATLPIIDLPKGEPAEVEHILAAFLA
jgi:alkanesulfonate monooxygenase SsuD/methylene tetrahydromethanopterin reductase-like flavin-dependent oxidoreductase (luciferase family)